LCQTLPLEEFTGLNETLCGSGYRPIRFRPHSARGRVEVAAIWTRDGCDRQVSEGLSAAEMLREDRRRQSQGFTLIDVAGYQTPKGTCYAGVWEKTNRVDDTRLLLDTDKPLLRDHFPKDVDAFLCERLQPLPSKEGQRRYVSLWRRSPSAWWNNWPLDERAYESELAIGASRLQVDVGLSGIPQRTPHERYSLRLQQAEKDLQARPNDPKALFNRAISFFHLRQSEAAIADLTLLPGLTPRTEHSRLFAFRAVAHAQLGHSTEARADLARHDQLCNRDGHRAYLAALVAAYLGQDEEAGQQLEAFLSTHSHEPTALFNIACAYSVLAGIVAPKAPERSALYANRAVAILQDSVLRGLENTAQIQADPDLEPIWKHPDYLALLHRHHLDREYSIVWQKDSSLLSRDVHGLDPRQHLERCRELAAEGYRPAALALVEPADGAKIAGSVWHRPIVSVDVLDEQARRQAHAGCVLLRLGRGERVWPLLQAAPDPRLRTWLIHLLGPLDVPATLIVSRLEQELNVSARRALILSLGEYTAEQLPRTLRQPLVERLLQWYRDDPDPGVHAAIDWLLRHGSEGPVARLLSWGEAEALERIDRDLKGKPPQGKRFWYVNGQGQTLALLPGPGEFIMGSPGTEPERMDREVLHRRRLGRSFALATREVTVRQFQEFLAAHPEVRHSHDPKSTESEGPILNVDWYTAAQYCRWLSEREGVTPEQMCYPSVKEIEKCKLEKTPLKLPADYLTRTGYRLPTEAEWEYACRADTTTSRYHGASEELLGRYAWYRAISGNHAWPCGQKKPNDVGLFDMLGNASEWCHDLSTAYRPGLRGQPATDKEEAQPVLATLDRVIRGSAYTGEPRYLRSANRITGRPTALYSAVGFRVARTQP
jgi:formylglycine-generating enzyme required for sulfatase activity